MLLESLFQARKSNGHIYVCLVYRLSMCDWILKLFRQCDICCLSFYPSPGTFIIALCTVVVTYQAIYIRMLLWLIQIGIQEIYCSSLCFLFIVLSTIFVFLSLFFTWSLCCLSLLKNSLKTPKRQSKPVNVRMDTTMTHSDLGSTTQKTKEFTAAGSPLVSSTFLYIFVK